MNNHSKKIVLLFVATGVVIAILVYKFRTPNFNVASILVQSSQTVFTYDNETLYPKWGKKNVILPPITDGPIFAVALESNEVVVGNFDRLAERYRIKLLDQPRKISLQQVTDIVTIQTRSGTFQYKSGVLHKKMLSTVDFATSADCLYTIKDGALWCDDSKIALNETPLGLFQHDGQLLVIVDGAFLMIKEQKIVSRYSRANQGVWDINWIDKTYLVADYLPFGLGLRLEECRFKDGTCHSALQPLIMNASYPSKSSIKLLQSIGREN